MKRILSVLTFAIAGLWNYSFAQDQSIMITAGGGIIGPACTNCGLLGGIQSNAEYGVAEKISVGATFNHYFDKDDAFGFNIKESVTHVGAKGVFYVKERFKGFYLSADLGYITYKTDWNGIITKQNNFTAGASLGWAISIADLIVVNPHIGYGSWFENSKGRVDMGLRIGVKF